MILISRHLCNTAFITSFNFSIPTYHFTFRDVSRYVGTPPTEHQPAVLYPQTEIFRRVDNITEHYFPSQSVPSQRPCKNEYDRKRSKFLIKITILFSINYKLDVITR